MTSPLETPGYRYATVTYPGDGTTVQFEFNFADGYIDQTDVHAWIRDKFFVETEIEQSSLVFVGSNQLKIPTAVSSGDTLVIRRVTPKDKPLLDYIDGAILNEKNLNLSTKQAIFSCAEMVDRFADLLDAFHGVDQNVIDALGFAQQALDKAQQALDAANNAVSIAQQALDNSNDALDKANQAIDTANQALDKANQALAAAQAAQDAAEAAEASASAAAQSASDAADSAAQALSTLNVILNAIKSMEIAIYVGIPLKYNNYECLRYVTARKWTTSNDLSAAVLMAAPTNSFTLHIQKNGTDIGTISWQAGETDGTLNFPSNNEFDVKDVMSIYVPTGDPSAEGLSLTIAGTRIIDGGST